MPDISPQELATTAGEALEALRNRICTVRYVGRSSPEQPDDGELHTADVRVGLVHRSMGTGGIAFIDLWRLDPHEQIQIVPAQIMDVTVHGPLTPALTPTTQEEPTA